MIKVAEDYILVKNYCYELYHEPCYKTSLESYRQGFIWDFPDDRSNIDEDTLVCENCKVITPLEVFHKANFICQSK